MERGNIALWRPGEERDSLRKEVATAPCLLAFGPGFHTLEALS
jgi:hypothetical protein